MRKAAGGFAEAVAARYQEATGIAPNVTVCEAADGAEVVTSEG